VLYSMGKYARDVPFAQSLVSHSQQAALIGFHRRSVSFI
jgi:hypothetical protein